MEERGRICFVFTSQIKGRTVVGRGADGRKPCRKVDATAKGERLERYQPLVVVHGQYAVEFVELAGAKEAIGRIRPEHHHAPFFALYHGRADDLLFLVPQHAFFPCVGVQAEHGDIGPFEAEVHAERIVENAELFDDVLFGDGGSNFMQRDVRRYQGHPQAIAGQQHQAIGGVEFLGEVFRVAHVGKACQLHGFFVDGGGHEGINEARFKIPHRIFEADMGVLAALVGGLAKGNIDVFLPAVHDVDLVVVQALRISLAIKGDFVQCHNVFVVRDHLRGAINDGNADIQHPFVRKRFQDDFQADAVDIADRDANHGPVLFVYREVFYDFGYFFHRRLLLLLLPGYVWKTFDVSQMQPFGKGAPKLVISPMRAKKSFGQHFLTNEAIAGRIADALFAGDGGLEIADSAAEVEGEGQRQVLEIGPGKGMLTKYLLQKNFDLKVVEADSDMVAYLKDNYPELDGRIIAEDFLKLDLASVFPNGQATRGNRQFSIIGNFPYNISSQIVFKMLEHRQSIPQLVGMFQKEMAERIIAAPGGKDYGIISVLAQAFYEGKYLFSVGNGNFNPPPKVQSGVIRLTRKSGELGCNEALFKKVVKQAFGQRRKMLRNTLKPFFQDPSVLEGDFFKQRPEVLGVAAFVDLTNQVQQSN